MSFYQTGNSPASSNQETARTLISMPEYFKMFAESLTGTVQYTYVSLACSRTCVSFTVGRKKYLLDERMGRKGRRTSLTTGLMPRLLPPSPPPACIPPPFELPPPLQSAVLEHGSLCATLASPLNPHVDGARGGCLYILTRDENVNVSQIGDRERAARLT